MILSGIVCFLIIPLTSSKFLGGTISWMKWPLSNKVKFTNRLVWENGTWPCVQNCSSAELHKIGQVPPSLSSLQWQCISGCNKTVKLSDINIVLSSVSSKTPGWEQEETYLFHNNPEKKYTVRLDGIPWAIPASGPGRLVASIDLRTRSDTNLPNTSPVAAVPPTLGIPFGCPSTITLPVEDPDADDIRARVAFPDECGGACTSLPKFILKPALGQIIIDAKSQHGYFAGMSYRVTLMIEDIPKYTIKVGNETVTPHQSLSKVPLQFTVDVIDDLHSCSDTDIKFTWPTIPDGLIKVSYPGYPIVGLLRYVVYLESLKPKSTEFMASVPGGMNLEELTDDLGRLNVSRVYASWKPLQDQSGDNIWCVWGMKSNRVTTDAHCVVGLINDIDECAGNQISCKNNGTCVNLWHRTTCKCPHGLKRDCTEKVTCLDFPCNNNGTCVETGSHFICLCVPGYTGYGCEIELDECASSPCKHGVCVNDVDKFYCSCGANYTGVFCETEIPKHVSLKTEKWPLIISCLAGVVGLVAAVTCCCLFFLCPAAKRRVKGKQVAPIHSP